MLEFRTDLALEAKQNLGINLEGIEHTKKELEDVTVSKIEVKTSEASNRIGKPCGNYVTVEVPALTDNFECTDKRVKIISDELKELIPKQGLVLVAGLGNLSITPDALGPKSASMVLATRHIIGEIAKSTGLEALRPVAVISPGVLGKTGIETGELIFSVSERLKPSCVIAIDALASRELKRLGCTVQLSDTGISPGSGIGNHRLKIDKSSLGVPVIGIGVPTVVDASTLAMDLIHHENEEERDSLKEKVSPRGESMIVTPREIDLLIERASKLIGMSINCALHPDFSPNDLFSLVS